MKKITYALATLAFVLSTFSLAPISLAVTLEADTLIKGTSQSTVYYYAADGKRYVFPNERIYSSWFTNFNEIKTLTDEELAQIPLGGVVHYRPGVLLVKIDTDPKVYAVGEKGMLRWIKNEQIASTLYGSSWDKLVDDIPASFFAQYFIGLPILMFDDFSPDDEVKKASSISHGRGLKLGHIKRGSDTRKCRAIPAVPAHKVGQKGRATPAISARDCARDKHDDDDDNDEETGLRLSSINTTISTSTATINWFTNKPSTSMVTYNTSTLTSNTSTNQVVSNNSLVSSHSLLLSGLTPSTTYYFQIFSTDNNGHSATSSERTFTTSPIVVAPDTTAPVISNVTSTPSLTSATITWNTDEASNSVVQYAKESLSTATSSSTVNSGTLVTNHSQSINGLESETTYYYIVKSTDASGNMSTSAERTFTTLSPADVTAPVISSLQAQTSSTTATITWTTNELANSLVKYALEDLSTASTTWTVNANTLVTSHSLSILDLVASTTYFFLAVSADANSNTTTSTQQTFVTAE